MLLQHALSSQVGNAFFSLTIHALPAAWRKVLVVTSHFHMPRTKALFEDMYQLASQDFLKDSDRSFDMHKNTSQTIKAPAHV
jgi:hypothetical protein